MVYPKHQALPKCPRKKAKMSTTTNDLGTPTTTTPHAVSSLSYQPGELVAISEMFVIYNTTIATDISSIRKLE